MSDSHSSWVGVWPMGPALVLLLTGIDGVRGVLAVGRLRGRRAFSRSDVEMVTSFAQHASVALELADLRREAVRMALLEDRTRIARDFHDLVIQQLFASGMTLQGIAGSVADPVASERIASVVDTLDEAIRQIRAAIFHLRPRAGVDASGHVTRKRKSPWPVEPRVRGCELLVGDTGFEPVTSSVSRKRATTAPIARDLELSSVGRGGGYGI